MQSRHAWPWRLVLWMLVLAVIAPGGLSKPEPDPGEPPVLDWPQQPPILPSEPVGYLPVSTSVGPAGEYRISVPLDVPPGIAGMAPSLALSYGSEGGDDVAGVGWSLSGTSILQRCAATPASDGYADGVDFIYDRFCLDGAKLVAVVGKYGAMGTEYRTERDPFATSPVSAWPTSIATGRRISWSSATTGSPPRWPSICRGPAASKRWCWTTSLIRPSPGAGRRSRWVTSTATASRTSSTSSATRQTRNTWPMPISSY